MKKILFLLAFTIGFISCNDEKHVWSFEDMFYFLHNDPSQEGWVEPVTKITVGPGAQVDLLVTRNAFAAKAHPKQTVKVISFSASRFSISRIRMPCNFLYE